MENLKEKSRHLSLILRHEPGKIEINPHGWAYIEDISDNTSISGDEILEIVRTDEKGRYEISSDGKKVRALYGHSIDVFPDLDECAGPPPVLYHGTTKNSLEDIKKEGITKQKRNFVHLQVKRQEAWKSGQRHGEPCVLVIDSAQMQKDGVKFFMSKNGFFFTEYVDPKYIKRVLDKKIILYSAWSFIPDKKFTDKMNSLGFSSPDDTDLRLNEEMISFVEDNMEKSVTGSMYYRAGKAPTFGISGEMGTLCFIDYIDTDKTWGIERSDYPFVGAERIVYYDIKSLSKNRVCVKEIF